MHDAVNADEQVEIIPEVRSSSRQSSRNKRSKKDEIFALMQTQNELQAEHYEECRKTWRDIQQSLKESARYQRKRYQIEEEQLKILKEKAMMDKEDRQLERKIKKKKTGAS